MNRRTFTIALPALATTGALAHHGWSSFDETRPIYLEGVVKRVKWQNPHAEAFIEINHKPIPSATVALPKLKQQAPVDADAVVSKAVPPKRSDKTWEVEFAPIFRMEAWKTIAPKVGDSIAVVGYTFKDEKGSATLRVEYWVFDGKLVPLRSMPA